MSEQLQFVYNLIEVNKNLVAKIHELTDIIHIYERDTTQKTKDQEEASRKKEELLIEVEKLL